MSNEISCIEDCKVSIQSNLNMNWYTSKRLTKSSHYNSSLATCFGEVRITDQTIEINRLVLCLTCTFPRLAPDLTFVCRENVSAQRSREKYITCCGARNEVIARCKGLPTHSPHFKSDERRHHNENVQITIRAVN